MPSVCSVLCEAQGVKDAVPPSKVNLLLYLLVTQLCLTLCDTMDCSLPGSSVLEIFQERILDWVAISFSKIVVIATQIKSYDLIETHHEGLIWTE